MHLHDEDTVKWNYSHLKEIRDPIRTIGREKIRENKPTDSIPLIPRERFVMIVSRSSGWLSRHGKPLLRFYEWHPAIVLSLSLSLSLFFFHSRGSPIAKPRLWKRDEENRCAKGRDRNGEARETETLVITWLLCTREGGLCSLSFLFLAFALAYLLLVALLFFLFFSRPRARFFSPLFSFSRDPLLLLRPELEQRRVPAHERDQHKHTDERTRAHAYRKAETKCTRVNES